MNVKNTSNVKNISLALQGGGAHGAFTWGVLDAILREERINICAISGASAGAMNAVALVEGMAKGGREGARKQLDEFWRKIGDRARYSPLQRSLVDRIFGKWNVDGTIAYFWFDWLSHVSSPYQLNPLNLNPLRDVLDEEIDFEAVRNCKDIQLFIGATNVQTSRVTVFEQKDLSAAHILASACLPQMFQAVEIDGVPYWDGGYTANPALFPLYKVTESSDLVIIQLNHLFKKETPKTSQDIENRLNEISFNVPLVAELRAIEFVQRLLEENKLQPEKYRKLRMHRISSDEALSNLTASSKINAELDFILYLFKKGKKTGEKWVQDHFNDIGEKATLDLDALLSGKHTESY